MYILETDLVENFKPLKPTVITGFILQNNLLNLCLACCDIRQLNI